MRKYFLLVVCLIFGLETFLLSQNSSEWKTVEFKNYTISYPADKRLTKDNQEGTFTLYLNQRDNLTMVVDDLSGYNLSLGEFSSQYIENLQSKYNVTVLQNTRTTVNNQPCQKIICSFDDGHGEIQLKNMYYILVKNNWAYTFSLTCEPSHFDELKPIAQKVANSFKFTK